MPPEGWQVKNIAGEDLTAQRSCTGVFGKPVEIRASDVHGGHDHRGAVLAAAAQELSLGNIVVEDGLLNVGLVQLGVVPGGKESQLFGSIKLK